MDSTTANNEIIETLIEKGSFSEAIPHLEQIMASGSFSAQQAVHLACSYQQTGDHAAAIDLFEQILAKEQLISADRALLFERLGYCFLAVQDVGKAAASFQSAIDEGESPCRAYIGLGLCCTHGGRSNEARAFFGKAVATGPEDAADAHNNLGVLAWTEANLEEALDSFKRALEIEPMHRDALPNLLTLMFTLESYEAAEPLLQSYLAAAPGNPELTYQLLYCKLKLGRPDEARALLHKLLDAEPGREDALALLAECDAA